MPYKHENLSLINHKKPRKKAWSNDICQSPVLGRQQTARSLCSLTSSLAYLPSSTVSNTQTPRRVPQSSLLITAGGGDTILQATVDYTAVIQSRTCDINHLSSAGRCVMSEQQITWRTCLATTSSHESVLSGGCYSKDLCPLQG